MKEKYLLTLTNYLGETCEEVYYVGEEDEADHAFKTYASWLGCNDTVRVALKNLLTGEEKVCEEEKE